MTAEFIQTMNEWGRGKVPFLFVVDFEMQKPVIIRLADIDPEEIGFDFQGFSNHEPSLKAETVSFTSIPISFSDYKNKFDIVYKHLNYGDSFLTNLTIKTKVQFSHTLHELFYLSKEKYKLYFKNEFLVFSPECFIKIENNEIRSFPMKGTIDADLPHAQETILNNEKEIAEHITIVDLIRSDLSRVAEHVTVKRFRYIDELITNDKKLLQVSSEIVGTLPADYHNHLGDILEQLLPAGSITGAPKTKTIEIIHLAEGEKRGYFTGVFGYFDGTNLDSGVMIRFIERDGENYFYRSGGGITARSNAEEEYKEALDKIYVPVN